METDTQAQNKFECLEKTLKELDLRLTLRKNKNRDQHALLALFEHDHAYYRLAAMLNCLEAKGNPLSPQEQQKLLEMMSKQIQALHHAANQLISNAFEQANKAANIKPSVNDPINLRFALLTKCEAAIKSLNPVHQGQNTPQGDPILPTLHQNKEKNAHNNDELIEYNPVLMQNLNHQFSESGDFSPQLINSLKNIFDLYCSSLHASWSDNRGDQNIVNNVRRLLNTPQQQLLPEEQEAQRAVVALLQSELGDQLGRNRRI